MDTKSDFRWNARAPRRCFLIQRAFSDRADTRAFSSVSYHYSVAYTPVHITLCIYPWRLEVPVPGPRPGSRGQRFAGE